MHPLTYQVLAESHIREMQAEARTLGGNPTDVRLTDRLARAYRDLSGWIVRHRRATSRVAAPR